MNAILAKISVERPTEQSAQRHAGAVVVGGDYQGLGIVRSLGRRGVPICVIDDEPSIARFSRYTSRFVHVESLREERKVVDTILNTGKRLGLHGWVLYPTREELVAAFSRNRAELGELFRVPTPEWDSVQWAWDKRNTYRLARELGIPTPRTFYLDHFEQLSELNDVEPPFVVKPAIKEHFFYATKAKAWYADSHSQLRERFSKASNIVGRGEVMVQEVIPGGGGQQFSYCAFFRDGAAVGSIAARRMRQHPLMFGRASTYVETVDIPEIKDLSERFLRSIDYYGLVELEYKLDPRDGQFKLLDVNARTWGYHSIGEAAGVDFSYMLFADQLGAPVADCRGKPGIGWVRMTTDIPAAVCALFAGEIDLRSYLRSLRTCNVEAVFSRRDPLPGIAELLMLPYLAIKRGF